MSSPSGYTLTPNSPLVQHFYRFYTNLTTITFDHLDLTHGWPGSITQYTFDRARQKKVQSAGEQNMGDLASENFCVWQLARVAMDDGGFPMTPFELVLPTGPVTIVNEPFLADHITGPDGRRWNIIRLTRQLMGYCYNAYCERIQ